ncbi:MAG: lipid-A-disaccharide synthase, partial [Pseudomonadota bacterium]
MKIFVIAGEASGDALGAVLIEALHTRTKGTFSGIGGPLMQEQGLDSLFDYKELSIMGLVEILPHIRRLRQRIAMVIAAIVAQKPDIVLTIDAPGFTSRVVQGLPKEVRAKRVHLVAPTVWAWKQWRAQKYAQHYDKLLVLFPFEPPYFTQYGLDCVFVGHPLADYHFDSKRGKAFRKKHAIGAETKLLGVFAGSRKSEIRRMLPLYVQALMRHKPRDLVVVFPTLEHLVPLLEVHLTGLPHRYIIDAVQGDDRYDAFMACDGALATSGTVGLELAFAGIPHVIAYRVDSLSAFILRKMVTTRYAHIFNYMQDAMIIPEYIHEDCTIANLCQAL